MLLPKFTFETGRVSGFKFGEKLPMKRVGLNVVCLHGLSVVLRRDDPWQVVPPIPEVLVREERS
jgi:hypothetical protein